MFPQELARLYETVKHVHENYEKNEITIQELYDLHLALNPALTYAAKHNLEILLEDISNEPLVDESIANEIVQAAHKREIARQAGEIAVNIINGRDGTFDDIRRVLDGYNGQVISELEPVSEDLEEILKGSEENTRWKFNIPTLSEKVAGIGPGSFTIIAARPEVGKTASWVSFAAGPDGFCHQGAKVVAIINEEKAVRTALRAWSACTGLNKAELVAQKDRARELYNSISGRLKCYDSVGLSIDDLYSSVELEKPDIVVVDQLDKVRVDGTFNRSDEKLREIYTRTRELAKSGNCAVIAISQLSADAEGKAKVDFSMLENSKTGKAAEADLIFCIGANPDVYGDPLRQINISKNKISGNHEAVCVNLNSELSRYGV